MSRNLNVGLMYRWKKGEGCVAYLGLGLERLESAHLQDVVERIGMEGMEVSRGLYVKI